MGKLPSGFSCSGTTVTWVTPSFGGASPIAHTLGVDGIHKVVQTFLAAVFDLALGKGCVKVRRLYGKAVYCFNGGKDLCCHLKGDLAAVCAVDLVAVVLGGTRLRRSRSTAPPSSVPGWAPDGGRCTP